ncbi:MAG TPA: T9SS type A sorting domain-containing protein, partial [Bacteroidales bacterium]|nr:T9SS type A sorting domain-containing protein [Bacteroidales bacterium]
TVTVNYTNGNGCAAATPTVYNVTVNALPTPTITGPASVCMGSTGNVYQTQTGMTGYTWTVSAGGTITAGAGTNAITVTWTTSGAKTVCVNYTNGSGCTAAAPVCYNVTVNAAPVPTISGPALSCQGNTATYTSQTGMTNYVWTVSAGGSIVSGQGTSTLNVTWNAIGAQVVTVTYTNVCPAAAPASYNVTVTGAPVPTIGSTNTPCVGSTDNIYYTESGMSNYVWTVSAGGTIVSGQGTSILNVTWNQQGIQTVTVNYTNAAGCSAATPTVYTVFVNTPPGAAGTITGTSTLCAGTNGVVYTTTPIVGATSYTWNVPSGAAIVSGQGSTSITVNFGVTAISGNVSVAGTNQCGNGLASNFAVTVNPLPAAAGAITGPASVCAGKGGYVYTVPTITSATGYVWTLPAGATITSGANTHSITVSFGNTPASGVITVYGTNTCGNGAVSPNFNVTINAVPAAPVVTANGPLLTSSVATGNQWYYEGTGLLPGATGQTYTATITGWYWSVVTVNGCSSDTSNHVYVLFVGQNEIPGTTCNVYPVPSDGRFNVSVRTATDETFTIEVYNLLGEKFYELKDARTTGGALDAEIDIRPAARGIYSVVFLNKESRIIRKMIVNR